MSSSHSLVTTLGGSLLYCRCNSPENSILVITKDSVPELSVIYGFTEVNGYVFPPKKFNRSNFVPVSLTTAQMPLIFTVRDNLMEKMSEKERIVSRLREFMSLADTAPVVKFAEQYFPIAIVLIKNEADFASRFISQQHRENIFNPRRYKRDLGSSCFLVNAKPFSPKATEQNDNSNEVEGEAPTCSGASVFVPNFGPCEFRTLLATIQRDLLNHNMSRFIIFGSKDSGKSTTIRYLANALNSWHLENAEVATKRCRVFVLDTDVGQSEFHPPGCVSLHEVKKPLLGASFARQERSIEYCYYFGSNSPGADFTLYKCIIDHLISIFTQLSLEAKEDNYVLLINTVGWVDGPGFNILCDILNMVQPTSMANIEIRDSDRPNFTVPLNYKNFCTNLTRRKAHPHAFTLSPATQRDFMVAGYFAQCFAYSNQQRRLSSELKLASVQAYQVRFASMGIYFHPELSHVTDRFLPSVLNCAVVGLCTVEKGFESSVESIPLLNGDDDSMPHRIIRSTNPPSDSQMPLLRCHGFGLIRSIDIEKKVFHVITPVEVQNLQKVKILALGYSLQTPEILFDRNSIQAVPYIVELDQRVIRGENPIKKLYEPLKQMSGLRRATFAGNNHRFAKKDVLRRIHKSK